MFIEPLKKESKLVHSAIANIAIVCSK